MKVAAVLGLMIALSPIRTYGQELLSTLSLTAEAGYLTNAYLHPLLPVWVAADAPFLALAPTASLAWVGQSTYAGISAEIRASELMDREEMWWIGTSRARLHHRLGSQFAMGADGSFSRIQMGVRQWLAWGAPYVVIGLGKRASLTARAGVSSRHYDADEPLASYNQVSSFAVAQLALSPLGRLRITSHVFATNSGSAAGDPLGFESVVEYSFERHVSLGIEAGAEWFGQDASNVHGAAFVSWEPAPTTSWSTRFGLQRFRQSNQSSPDVFASLSFTYRIRHRKDLSPPAALNWSQDDQAVTVRYRYEGDGELYIVADFNGWRIGETPLRSASNEIYSARVSLPPGKYEYKIVEVDDGRQRWLPLPDEVLTTDDNFGGTNGILIVE